VTWQERTFTRKISRNQRLRTKTPEKEHVDMASQAEWKLVSKIMSWFSPQVLWLTPLL